MANDALALAAERDAADPLARFRARFYVPDGVIYLDGNSLGLLSREAEASVLAALGEWRQRGIGGWTGGERPWYWLGEELGARSAPLVGALPHEVVVTGAITVNLHALFASFYRPTGRRDRIVVTALDFPSDLYAAESWPRLLGRDPAACLLPVESRDGRTIEEDDIIRAMARDDVALVWLPSVLYRSGQLLDMARLTREAHARGVLIGFDCAHSAGVLPHQLHEWGVDFAVWCTYKYLNAGPGAVGALYVHERHHGLGPGLAGWWGSDKARQFAMSPEFTPAAGAGAWQISTPSVLGAAALDGALTLFEQAGIDAIRTKSLDQTAFLIDLIDRDLTGLGFSVGTPREPARRGGHVALEHPAAVQVAHALRARGVVPDFREPNVIRLAPIALHTTYAELAQTAQVLREIVTSGAHLAVAAERGVVA